MGLKDRSSKIEMPREVGLGWTPWFRQTGAVAVAADVLPIPVTHAIVTKVTGADAEALTLGAGDEGQVIHIHIATDGGGDGTLTPVTATGWATIVFADAGDRATLMYVNSTVGWIILSLSGVAGPPLSTV